MEEIIEQLFQPYLGWLEGAPDDAAYQSALDAAVQAHETLRQLVAQAAGASRWEEVRDQLEQQAELVSISADRAFASGYRCGMHDGLRLLLALERE